MGVSGESDPAGRSFEAIEQFRATLIAEAVDIFRQDPDARIVGMVIESDAPEAKTFRQLLPPDSRGPSQGFVGIVPREIALQLLGAAAPAALDWLEDDGNGRSRRLPVIYAARTGLRTAAVEYDVG